MSFITGKALPRRTFLRGMGATVALPWLDAMMPAGRLGAEARAAIDKPRLVAIENVHGAAGSNEWGMTQNLWSPAAIGRDFDLSPTALASLEPFRDRLTIVSNTDVRMAEAFQTAEIGGDHFRSTATFLTQAHAKITEGSDVYQGTSMDQLFAQRSGQETPIPSMQLCIENVDQAGGCAYGYACVYTDSLSWASPTEPLPMIRDPRAAFDKLFGAGGTPEERAYRRRENSSILDWIAREMAQVKRQLGPADVQRIDQYTQSIRELERRIERVEAQNSSGEARELPGAPAGVPDSFREHVELMFDLQLLAFESDTTRVFTLKLGRDASGRVYPESGIDKAFHPASHHGGNEQAILDFHGINKYHVSLVPYLLERLRDRTEGDASLLDKTLVLYGSAMGDPNLHNHVRCPLFFVGGANGGLKGNVHIKAPDRTPMANAMLSALHALGMDDLDHFGDSTGELALS
ncbi:MAG: DUF1552 domain-containing protein [Gemmatimonadetes bacterium]|nr:DUF1552 domain-containing protein [Gemmatimonadota bacterium]